MTERSLSLYIHIPFCRTRCSYCDFNTYAGMERWLPDYVTALKNEIRQAESRDWLVDTIFLGGGTPSLLPAKHIEDLFTAVREGFVLSDEAEITLEVNPGDLSAEWLMAVQQLGVNRISVGAQSAQANELAFLTRRHSWDEVERGVNLIRASAIDNISLDLIYGIPGQTLESWADSLAKVLALRPAHVSLYGLAVEENTPLAGWVRRGLIRDVDEDFEADCYELAREVMERAGFEHYEISNWALPGSQCRHNLQYWRYGSWLGFGAGAHGLVEGVRTINAAAISDYIVKMRIPSPAAVWPAGSAAVERHVLSPAAQMEEYMLTGLRLVEEGVSEAGFQARFHRSLEDYYAHETAGLLGRGLLEWTPPPARRLRLTPRGYLLANLVLREFVEGE